MLSTYDIRDWLENENKDKLPNTTWNANKYDKKTHNQSCVYYLYKDKEHRKTYIGGYSKDITDYFTILIYGNDNFKESRKIAEIIFEYIQNLKFNKNKHIGSYLINSINLLTNIEDVSDYEETNTYEFVIQFEINYEESEE